jgi:hemoglobin-like flavoprotein
MTKTNTIFTVAEVLHEPLTNVEYSHVSLNIENRGYGVVEVHNEDRSIWWEVEVNLQKQIISAWKPRYKQTQPFVEALDAYFWPARTEWARLVWELNQN